jgi:hypothetical protein
MRTPDKLRLRLRSLLRRRDVDRELEYEFRFHLDQMIEEGLSAGLEPDDARRSALRKKGSMSQLQEECREMRRVNYVENALQDLRYAIRQLWANPIFALTAILSLALGIGANAAIFTARERRAAQVFACTRAPAISPDRGKRRRTEGHQL